MALPPPPVPPARLAAIFLRIGAVAFGGLGATLALIERELVQRRGLASKEILTEAVTYTKLLPGSTVVQVVAYLGWRVGGRVGSAIATACFILPAAVLMIALASGYERIASLPAIVSVRRGVLAAVAAILLVTMGRLGRPLATGWLPVALGVGALVAVAVFRIGAPWVVLAAGVIGVLVSERR
jgi:chromate transporter